MATYPPTGAGTDDSIPPGSPFAPQLTGQVDMSKPSRSVFSPDGTKRTDIYPDGSMQRVEVSSGKVLQTKNVQYGAASQRVAVLGKDPAQLASQKFNSFGRQSRVGTSGVYSAPGAAGFDFADFARRQPQIEQAYAGRGGMQGFLKDIQNPATSETATRWFQQSVNDQWQKEGRGTYFQTDGTPNAHQLDGKFGISTFSVPAFSKPNVPPPTAGNTPAQSETVATDPNYQGAQPADTHWWQQNIVDLAAAVTDKVNRYNPMLQQVKYETPDYALLDPTRQIAASQEQQAQYNDLVQNTSSGQVARANVLAGAGESGAHIADIIASYDNQNVGLSNAASSASAQIHNQQTDTNTRYLDKFVGESATVNQQYDNAMRDKKYRVVDALNNGTTQAQKQTQLEQVMPQIHVNRSNGYMDFSGNGKDLQYDQATAAYQDPETLRAQSNRLYQESMEEGRKLGIDEKKLDDYAKFHTTKALTPPKAMTRSERMYQMYQRSGRRFRLGGEVLPSMPDFGS